VIRLFQLYPAPILGEQEFYLPPVVTPMTASIAALTRLPGPIPKKFNANTIAAIITAVFTVALITLISHINTNTAIMPPATIAIQLLISLHPTDSPHYTRIHSLSHEPQQQVDCPDQINQTNDQQSPTPQIPDAQSHQPDRPIGKGGTVSSGGAKTHLNDRD
jgi:hypothetical protein